MSRRRGISPIWVALLAIPVVLGIGAYAYTASESMITNAQPCISNSEHWASDWHGYEGHRHGMSHEDRPVSECGTHEHERIDGREVVAVDGTVVTASVDDRVIAVEDSSGEVYEFKVGGRWADADDEWVPYYYLLENITVGDDAHVEGYVGCDGGLRAYSITIDGVTYTWLTGGHGQ